MKYRRRYGARYRRGRYRKRATPFYRRRKVMWRRRNRAKIGRWRRRAKNTHYIEQTITGQLLHAWDVATFAGQSSYWPYWAIAKGDNTYDRTGDKIRARSVTMKMGLVLNSDYFTNNPDQPRAAKVRMIVGKVRAANQRDYFNQPMNIINDLLATNAPGMWNSEAGFRNLVIAQYVRGNNPPLKIISDKVYTLDCATGPSKHIQKTFKLNGEVRYAPDVGAYTQNCFTGQYFMFWTCDLSPKDEVVPVTLTYAARANFVP